MPISKHRIERQTHIRTYESDKKWLDQFIKKFRVRSQADAFRALKKSFIRQHFKRKK